MSRHQRDLFPTTTPVPALTGQRQYPDAKMELWAEGRTILLALGVGNSRSRPLIGKWLKDAHDNPKVVLEAIRSAETNRVVDPVMWITAAIRPNSFKPKAKVGEDQQRETWARLLEAEKRTGQWPSKQIHKRDIPVEFVSNWEAGLTC